MMAAFLVGLLVGGFIGVMTMCVFIVSTSEERREERISVNDPADDCRDEKKDI